LVIFRFGNCDVFAPVDRHSSSSFGFGGSASAGDERGKSTVAEGVELKSTGITAAVLEGDGDKEEGATARVGAVIG
jgi:hypothetical protein